MKLCSPQTIPIWGLVCLITAAFFSKGFHHFDEHFQILEFAALKLGLTTEANLPWEFREQMRSSLQPWIVVASHKLFALIGKDNPFWVTTFLRLVSALLSWFAAVLLLRTFSNEVNSKSLLNRWVTPLCFLFCFTVYTGVRFSSENWGALFFVFGLCLAASKKPSRYLSTQMLAGFCLGISFVCRFQMGLMISGLGLWLILQKQESSKSILSMLLGFLSALALGFFLDHHFYGGWPVTFWNYLRQNLLLGKAAQFGSSPWYQYLLWLFAFLIPPFSLLLVPSFLRFFWMHPKHVLSFCLVPYLVVHFLLSHKEVRFLFPILCFLPFITASAFKPISGRLFSFFVWGFWGLNFPLLLFVLFRPADGDVKMYEAIYFSGANGLAYETENPFHRADGMMNYYIPRNFSITAVGNLPQQHQDSGRLLIASLNPALHLPKEKLIYKSLPSWLPQYNFNGWLNRVKSWKVYWGS